MAGKTTVEKEMIPDSSHSFFIGEASETILHGF